MWPELPYNEWCGTLDTVHMWLEIVGKIKLALSPFLNQWWEVAFTVTTTGLTTGLIAYNDGAFQIDFSFVEHTVSLTTTWGQTASFELRQQSVAAFYEATTAMLLKAGITVAIWPVPVEVTDPIPFAKDSQHATYDRTYVERWWYSLVRSAMVFEQFRSSFRGKSSPVHFFWGSFDLCSSRFSGKKAQPPKAAGVMGDILRYAENEENFTFGSWPGDKRFPSPAYYAYMYPQPDGTSSVKLSKGAFFHEQLSECLLPYDTMRSAPDPAKTLLRFLESSYRETAALAGWDVRSLRNKVPPAKQRLKL